VIQDQEAEAFGGFVNAREPGAEAFEYERKGHTLNKIEEMLLVLKVVVEAREGDTGFAADIAHGSPLKAVLGKDLGGSVKDVLELGL